MNAQLNDELRRLGEVRAVVFDLFGTLLQITRPKRPYASLRQMIESNLRSTGRTRDLPDLAEDVEGGATAPGQSTPASLPDFARMVMTEPLAWTQVAQRYGATLTAKEVAHLDRELRAEVESICLFDDVIDTLTTLRTRTYQIAICSNLTRPYAIAARKLLPKWFATEVMSCEVGFIKPHAAIYERVVAGFDPINDGRADPPLRPIRPDEILFIGDRLNEDVQGPQAFGMHAMQIVR